MPPGHSHPGVACGWGFFPVSSSLPVRQPIPLVKQSERLGLRRAAAHCMQGQPDGFGHANGSFFSSSLSDDGYAAKPGSGLRPVDDKLFDNLKLRRFLPHRSDCPDRDGAIPGSQGSVWPSRGSFKLDCSSYAIYTWSMTGPAERATFAGRSAPLFSQEIRVVTKKEIVKTISDEIGLTQLKTKEIVQKTFDAIVETLVDERRIELRNFGVFEVKQRAGTQSPQSANRGQGLRSRKVRGDVQAGQGDGRTGA